jgi:hypothetical protein
MTAALAKIEGDEIVIRLPIENIPIAFAGGVAAGNIDVPYRVTNAGNFAHDVVTELRREEEDGTTPVHRMFDDAFVRAIEWGGDGVTEVEDIDEAAEPYLNLE